MRNKIAVMDKAKKIRIALLLQVLIIAAAALILLAQERNREAPNVSVLDWRSDYTTYNIRDGWQIDEKKYAGTEPISLIVGPDISLKSGTYRIKVEYFCDHDQKCGVYDSFHLKAGEARLSRHSDTLQYDFAVTGDVDHFEFKVKYDGTGYLQVTGITIITTSFGAMKKFCILLGLFFCLDLCLLFSDSFRKHRDVLKVLAGIVLLSSLPLFMDGIFSGDDLGFHLTRIAGIAKELRQGNIPVRLSTAWMDGYGYPVSIYYGDLLLYLPALMSLVGFSLTAAYKFYIFMINVGTAAITYYSMNRVCRDTRVALLATLAYCTASYRLTNIYVRAAVGESGAMMFLPLIAAAVYGIYTDEVSNRRQYRKNAVLLAVGMSGLLMTHMLSVTMVVFVLLFVCLSLPRRTFRRETVQVYLLAIVGTCVLSAYFIVPFLDYAINVPIKMGPLIPKVRPCIQQKGMTVGEYFMFFRRLSYEDISKASGRRLMSPGLTLMAAFLIAAALCRKTKDRMLRWLTAAAALTMCVTLTVFPWDYLSAHCILFAIMARVQFPYRYVGIALVFLTLLLAHLLRKIRADVGKMTRVGGVIAAAAFVMTAYFTLLYADDGGFVAPYGRAELNGYALGDGEYLRKELSDNVIWELPKDVVADRMAEATIVERSGSSMRVRCVASDKGGGCMCAPVPL